MLFVQNLNYNFLGSLNPLHFFGVLVTIFLYRTPPLTLYIVLLATQVLHLPCIP